MESKPREVTPARFLAAASGALVLMLGLYLCSLHSRLLFYSVAGTFSIVVAFGIFMVGWNSRQFLENGYFLFLGIAYLFVGLLDLVHTFSHEGMNVLAGSDANTAAQLWVAARATESLSLLLAPLFVRRGPRLAPLVVGYAGATGLLLAAIFPLDLFPACFVEGRGLTPFKVGAEYAISAGLLVSAFLLHRVRNHFDRTIYRLLLASIFVTVASGLSFTLFQGPFTPFDMPGHYLKIISYFLIYRAIVYTGLKMPFSLLDADLRRNRRELERAHTGLELRVQQRTAELEATNEVLRREIAERERAQEALRESEELYATLVEASLTGVYMQQGGRVLFANRRFADLFGYGRDEVIGMETLQLVHPEDRSRILEIQSTRLRGEDAPDEYEVRGLTRDGGIIWVNRRVSLVQYKGRPAILGNVADVTKRKQMEHELRLLSSRILSAEEKERKRIAQDLHDGLGQLLGAIKFRVESFLLRLDEDGADSERGELEEIVTLIRRTIEEMRRILSDLRPSMLDDLGIVPTIGWLSREFQRTHPEVTVEKALLAEEQDVPDELKTVIYRVFQETLNNVAKHSRADRVRLSLVRETGGLVLEVEDNGVGFDEHTVPHGVKGDEGIGLHSIRERCRFSGGRFVLETGRGEGTRIRVTWP
jgi:PAS domain S-box-containing protein